MNLRKVKQEIPVQTHYYETGFYTMEDIHRKERKYVNLSSHVSNNKLRANNYSFNQFKE